MTLWAPPEAAGGDIIPTGSIIAYVSDTPPDGWLNLNGDTIGNAVSGATHAGSQYETLFELVKNLPPNLGTENWAAGNTVTLPTGRQRFMLGLSGGGTGSTMGGTGGQIDHVHGLGSHQHETSFGWGPNDGGGHDQLYSSPKAWGTGNNLPDTTSHWPGPGVIDFTTTGGPPVYDQVVSVGYVATTAAELTNQAVGNTDTQNPRFLTMNWIVKI